MPSIFTNASESSDVMNEFEAVVDPQTLAEASAVVMEEYQDVEASGKLADALVDEQAKVMDIQDDVEVALEHGGLSPRAQRILKKSLIAIIGKNLTSQRIPAMESDDRETKVTATVLALEGIMQTVKDFWTAIRNQVTSFWNKTKSWYIKTFDVSNKIIARAKAVSDRTNAIAAAAKENSFEFSNIKMLAVNYQVKDPNACIAGFEALNQVINGAVENLSKENSSAKADALLDNLKNMLSSTRNNASKQFQENATNGQANDVGQLFSKAINDWYTSNQQENPFKPVLNQQVNDPALRTKLNGADDRIEVLQGPLLPGSRALFHTAIDVQKNPNVDPIELLKANRPVISDPVAKPKEMEDSGDVKTLNSGQITKIATIAEEMGTTILKYKKEFEARDRYFNKMMKGFDQMVRDIDGSNIATESFDGFAMEGNGNNNNQRYSRQQRIPQNGSKQNQTNSNSATTNTTQTTANTSTSGGTSAASNNSNSNNNVNSNSGSNNNVNTNTTTTTTTNNQNVNPAANTTATQTIQSTNQQSNNQQDQKDEAEKKAIEAVDKYFRRLVSAFTGSFKRDISYQGQLITLGIKSANVYLTYAEQSLSQYGA